MLFSVIVPVYNVEDYLSETLSSILGQSYRDLELILVDDGSTDRSGSICDHYASEDRRVRVIHKQNSGVSSARNSGIRLASGDYLLFVDGDDLLDKNALEGFAKALKERTNLPDILFADLCRFHQSASLTTRLRHGYNIPLLESLHGDALLAHLFGQMRILGSTAWAHTYRKEFIRAHDLYFDEDLIVAEDNDWLLKVLLSMRTCSAANICTYMHRVDSLSSISNKPMTLNTYRSNHTYLVRWFSFFLTGYEEVSARKIMLPLLSRRYVDISVHLLNIEDAEERRDAVQLFAQESHMVRYVRPLIYHAFYPIKIILGHGAYLRAIALAKKLNKKRRKNQNC